MIPTYQAYPWLQKTLDSVAHQSYQPAAVCVIDDHSSDLRIRKLLKQYARLPNWIIHFNQERRGTLHNLVEGIKQLDCEDEDILIFLDGDDWLFNDRVLFHLNRIYQEEPISLTYGQFIYFSHGAIGLAEPCPEEIVVANAHRLHKWIYGHLRTTKYYLWKEVRDCDLRGKDGAYYSAACDLAYMYPLVEMAGKSTRFIKEITCIYNDLNPLNDFRIRPRLQKEIEQEIRQKTPYPPLKGR